MQTRNPFLACLLASLVLSPAVALAAPPAPSSAHPRLFMSQSQQTQYAANAVVSGTAAAEMIHGCDDTFDSPDYYDMRGGADGDNWPGSAVRCAFAYRATGNQAYLTQALKYWHASLDDDQVIGDGLGCVSGVNTDWQSWDGNPPAPPVILTVAHDTGYPIRWYGPYIALTYDWLYDAPGVDESLRGQTRTCLGAWVDFYSDRGYHHDEAGANYNAGFVIAKTFSGIAIGTDGGADGHLWSQTVDDLFPNLIIGQGLMGADGQVGQPAGVLVGGDWPEGWQYGPLSVVEYSASATALSDQGINFPEMSEWANSLALRLIYSAVPDKSATWIGGDYGDEDVYAPVSANMIDAVLIGPSSDTAAGYANSIKQSLNVQGGYFIYNAVAELRNPDPIDYSAQQPAPPLWYLARGTRAMHVRTSWASDAYWSTFSSSPSNISDHIHYAASNFVFSRGGDHLIVDSSTYGGMATLGTNAVTVDTSVTPGDYQWTQTPWSQAELVWARGTNDAVYAARSDFAKAFNFADTPSNIPYAHREWVMLPEGEIVTIDRVHTEDAAHAMVVGFHTNTQGGGLSLNNGVASGTVGNSQVVIHPVSLSGGTPEIQVPDVGDCMLSCSFPCGQCQTARFAVDKYAVTVPGPFAVSVHVIDGLGNGEQPAQVNSVNDDVIDPAPKQNQGILGAAVYRGERQTYVIATSAQDGNTGATMTYSVPGSGASRHIVFDAPEDANGQSVVTTSLSSSGDRCVINITAGAGFQGHPLMFKIGSVAEGCLPTEDTAVDPADPPVGGAGGTGGTAGSSGQSGSSGNAGTAGSAGNSGSAGISGSSGNAGSAGNSGGSGGAGGSSQAGSGGSGDGGSSPSGGSSGASVASNGSAPSSDDSGCGCRVVQTNAPLWQGWAAFALAVGLMVRRRKAKG